MTEKKKEKKQKERDECAICLGNLNKSLSLLHKKLSCGHIYHRTCISAWWNKNEDCPMCRKNINMSMFDKIFNFLVSCN